MRGRQNSTVPRRLYGKASWQEQGPAGCPIVYVHHQVICSPVSCQREAIKRQQRCLMRTTIVGCVVHARPVLLQLLLLIQCMALPNICKAMQHGDCICSSLRQVLTYAPCTLQAVKYHT